MKKSFSEDTPARAEDKKSKKKGKKPKNFKIENTPENIAFLTNLYNNGRSAKAKQLQQEEEEEE